MTTTARRVQTCTRCGFANDHIKHLRSCVPTSQWPRDLRERKASAMGHAVPDDPDREPEQVKPMGLAEYRRLHPEANPLTAETMTVREFRKREDGGADEWDRVIGVREALNQASPCPRCHRPLLDRAMHITCKPVDGSVIPEDEARDKLKRDDVPLTPRQPKAYTQADVRTGTAWYESLPASEEPATDEDELQDFLALDSMTPEQAAEEYTLDVDPEVLGRVVAEMEAGKPAEAAPFTCPTCAKVSKSAAGDSAHQRSHRKA